MDNPITLTILKGLFELVPFYQFQPFPDEHLCKELEKAFKNNLDAQIVVYNLIHDRRVYDLPNAELDIIAHYSRTLNIKRDVVASTLAVCLRALEGCRHPFGDMLSPKQFAEALKNEYQQQATETAKSKRLETIDRARRQQQLDTHPQVPYPPYTLWENIRDYWSGISDFILTTVVWGCGVVLGLPTYLISRLFNYFDKSNWNVYLWCVYGVLCLYLIYKGIETYSNYKHSLTHIRNQNYYPQQRLQEIIAKKGYTKKAEEIMRAAYMKARAIKDDSTAEYLVSIFERAYQDAMEDVMCYFNDDDRWWYLEINNHEGCSLESYSCLYEKYYGNKAFNPRKYDADIFGHFMDGRPLW